jgi:hypothetical protein
MNVGLSAKTANVYLHDPSTACVVSLWHPHGLARIDDGAYAGHGQQLTFDALLYGAGEVCSVQ